MTASGGKPAFDASAFTAAIRHLYKSGKYEPEMLADPPFLGVVTETNRVLTKALAEGIADNQPPEAMLRALQNDVFVFSGYKTHAQLREVADMLLTADGKIKPFSQFRQEVQSVHKAYNVNYLEAEYIFATSSAQMAAKWGGFEADGDRYNLQYRTAQDDRVRDAHAALANTTLPADDAFWDSYFPPNGWRCRCTAVQVRIGKYPLSNSIDAIKKGDTATSRIDKKGNNPDAIFRYNPGKQKILFPPNHPYRKVQDGVKRIIEGIANQQEWTALKEYRNGGSVSVHKTVKRTANDYQDIMDCCEHFAGQGNKTAIYPKVVKANNPELYAKTYPELIGTKYEGKSPDFKVGKHFYELEGYTTKSPGSGTIKHMVQRGAKQSSRVVIAHIPGTSDHFYRKRVFDITGKPNSKVVIDELWIKDGKELRQVYKKQ